MEDLRQRIAFLELIVGLCAQVRMALHRLYPAAFGQDDCYRLALDKGLQRDFAGRRGFDQCRTPAPQFGILCIAAAQLGQVFLQPRTLPGWAFDQLDQFLTLGNQVVAFAAQLHFLKPAQAAQPHIQDRLSLPISQLKFSHHDRFGLILGPNDLNNPVEIEIGNNIAIKQFQPRIDLFQSMLRPADKHIYLMRQPFAKHFAKTHNLGHAIGIEHVHVQAETRLKVSQPE